MKSSVLAAVALICASCAPGGTAPTSPQPSPPAPATADKLAPYYGSYRSDDGDTFIIARLGWFFDLRDSAYRTIYATSSPGHFTIGFGFLRPVPKFADLSFHGGSLTVGNGSHSRVGQRLSYRETNVMVPAAGAELAATITEPSTPGPHPGIVIVHGSERGQRYFYDIWVGVYATLGLAVLTYDKRGVGSSTGVYPGEFPTIDALSTYADDANAALGYLSAYPGVERRQVGFHGGSQGGWTVPLALMRRPQADFAILVSAPATTVDQTDQWSGFSSGGTVMPTRSMADMQAAVRATHTGYDPAPALQALSVPALWLLGSNDRTVPTAICVEILSGLRKPNISVRLLPTGHSLLVNLTGLTADDDRSPGLAPQLVPNLKSWLQGATPG